MCILDTARECTMWISRHNQITNYTIFFFIFFIDDEMVVSPASPQASLAAFPDSKCGHSVFVVL